MSMKSMLKNWLGITDLEADVLTIGKDVVDLSKLKAGLNQEIARAFDEILRENPAYSNYYGRDLRGLFIRLLDRKIGEATNNAVIQLVANECNKQLSTDNIVATIVEAINRRQLRIPLDN